MRHNTYPTCFAIYKWTDSGSNDRNLMAKDEFKNLGFGEDKPAADEKKTTDDGADQGKKGELRW